MGMFDFVEPRVRRVVAEQLGVNAEDLAADISLTDDLAADSLDLVELAIALENEMGVTIPESTIEEVRTFGDLLTTVHGLIRQRRKAEVRAGKTASPAPVWARVLSPRSSGEIHRAGWLTPYTAETIAQDALRAGRAARLEGYERITSDLGHPYLVPAPGSHVDGLLLEGVDALSLRELDRYEDEGALYLRRPVEVIVEGARVACETYLGAGIRAARG